MIVKCSNCESAFTVSDEKVSGKKFAFSCPNCSHNNIIDNTGSEAGSATSSASAESISAPATPSGAPIFDKQSPVSQKSSEASDFQDSDFSLDDNFDSDDSSDFDDKDGLSDFDTTENNEDKLPSFDDEDDENNFSDFDLDDDSPTTSTNIDYDEMDYDIEPEIDLSVLSPDNIPAENKSAPETSDDNDEITVDLDSLDIDFDDETDTDVRETSLPLEDDENEELSVDLDSLDIDLDDDTVKGDDFENEELNLTSDESFFETDSSIGEDDEDIPIDLDNLDIDLEEDDDLVTSGPAFTLTEDESEDISLTSDTNDSFDLDDIDLESDEFDNDMTLDISDDSSMDDDLSIDLENLDIDLDTSDAKQAAVKEQKDYETKEEYNSDDDDNDDDDEINIDLDSLDIELDESDMEPVDNDLMQLDDSLDDDLFDDIAGDNDDDQLSATPIALPADDDDNDITIDLDKLNVDLDDDAAQLDTDSLDTERKIDSDETIDLDSLDADFEESDAFNTGEDLFDEDESISIDLDTLDLGSETASVESDGEDESRLSLSDAGLTLDEIETESVKESFSSNDLSLTDIDDDEDELHLTADEVNINLDDVTEEDESSSIFDPEPDNFDEFDSLEHIPADELPELDLDRFDEIVPEKPAASSETDIFDIGTYESGTNNDDGVVGPGYIQFSVDYSLRYSRIKALLKFFGIYYILYIPHFIVLMLYMTVSSILTFINTVIVLFTSHTEKDFTAFQEKTLRYGIGLYLSIFNITEELPHFAGATDIDHQLQLHAYPPVKFSRVLAFMRLSFIGIFIITLPHILILSILSFAVLFFHLLGLVSVIVTGKWPAFVFDFMVRYFRYLSNICAYITGIVDSYPSFRFE